MAGYVQTELCFMLTSKWLYCNYSFLLKEQKCGGWDFWHEESKQYRKQFSPGTQMTENGPEGTILHLTILYRFILSIRIQNPLREEGMLLESRNNHLWTDWNFAAIQVFMNILDIKFHYCREQKVTSCWIVFSLTQYNCIIWYVNSGLNHFLY